jgi:hypothetical protein
MGGGGGGGNCGREGGTGERQGSGKVSLGSTVLGFPNGITKFQSYSIFIFPD